MRRTRLLVCLVVVTLTSAGCEDDPVSTMTEVHELTGPPGTIQQTLVGARSTWQFHDRGVDLGTGWRIVPSSSDWAQGAGPLGYGEPYLQTIVSFGSNAALKHPTTYFRKTFPVADRARVKKLYLRVMYDDGFVFYLNGKEGGRAFMPSGTITFTTLALSHEASNQYTTFDVSAQIPNLVTGANSLAIEVHQVARSSSDLVMDAELIAFVEPFEPARELTPRGIPAGATWSFWDKGGDLGTAWRHTTYVESGWSSGAAPLGFGEPYIQTQTRPGVVTTYFRHQFTSNGNATGLYLDARYDDGFVAYLNGVEVARASMPTGTITPSTLAIGHEAGGFERILLTHAAPLVVEGVNTLAIEVHQVSTASSDLVWDAKLVEESAWQPLASGTTADLEDVAVYFDGRVWVVGGGGTLLRTHDGGATWRAIATATTADLTAIDIDIEQFGPVPETFRGLAVGAGGTILQSRDDATWIDRSLGVPIDLTAISCVGGNSCWVVGRAGTPAADLYVTTDGGDTWQPRPTGIPAGSWTTVYFKDTSTGWIGGTTSTTQAAEIYGTRDGGLTWARQPFGAPRGSLPAAIVNQSQGSFWMVGEAFVSGSGTSGELKMVTRDGQTWEHTADTGGGPIYDLVFTGLGHGVGVGWHGAVITTDDGGGSWRLRRVPDLLRHATLRGVGRDPADIDVLYAVGDAGTILKTESAAIDWGWVRREVRSENVGQTFADIAFLDERHGWAVGVGLWETRDGGNTWTQRHAITGTTLEVLDAQHLWIGFRNQVWRSTDGGATFTHHTMSDDLFMRDLSFVSPTVGWMGVDNRWNDAPVDLYRTLDGGVTWQRAPTGTDGEFTGVHFVDAQNGWIAGSTDGVFSAGRRATILRTRNGGASWELAFHTAAFWDELVAIEVRGTTVIAVGGSDSINGHLLVASRDGGVTWTETGNADERPMTDVSVVDASHAWAVGIWGGILATRDSGATWLTQRRAATWRDHLLGVDFVDRFHGWAVGTDGAVLKTSTGGY